MSVHCGIRRFILLAVLTGLAGNMRAQLAEKLEAAGMENVKAVRTEQGWVASFEDRLYRSSYEGVGKAVEAALACETAGQETVLVVTDENGIPVLRIGLPGEVAESYRAGNCGLKEGTETRNRSSWKPDLCVYPQVFLENTSFDKLYRYSISLAPALEMPLWKGAELTAQVIFPIVGNQQGELKQIRPGVVALKQGFYWKRNWKTTIEAGLLTNHRDGRWELGGRLGLTVYSLIDNQGWTVTNRPKVNAGVYARAYIPVWNTEVTVEGNRFVYGDYGVKGDLTRHFGEYTVGLYGIYTGGMVNGGFSFAIPLPGRKYKRWKGMRVKPADYFSYTYSMVAWGEYIDRNLGRDYQTQPGENRSKGFYQPDFIKDFLIKHTNN